MFRFVFLFLLLLLISISPIYFQVSPGGGGLFIPANNFAWVVFWLFSAFGMLLISWCGKFLWNTRFFGFLALFFIVVIAGLFVDVLDYTAWFFRVFAILGGVLLFFLMPQVVRSSTEQNFVVFCFVLGGWCFLLAYVAREIFGVSNVGTPFGQRNLLATASCVGVLAALYLRHFMGAALVSIFGRFSLDASVFLLVFFAFFLGSRVGALGVIVGIVFMSFYFLPKEPVRKSFMISVLIVFCGALGGTFFGGGDRFAEKLDRMSDGTDARYYLYSGALRMLTESDGSGVGFGGYERRASDMLAQDNIERIESGVLPVSFGSGGLTHPHNEVLYWVVEGGFWGVLIVLVFSAFLGFCFSSRPKLEGFLFLGLASPLLLHALVELPFYVSIWHWFALVVILALSLDLKRNTCSRFSVGVRYFCAFIVAPIFLCAAFFHVSTLRSLDSMSSYVRTMEISDLVEPSRNYYLSEFVELMLARQVFYSGLQSGNSGFTAAFISVAESYLKVHSNPVVYEDLCRAYLQVGDMEQFERVLAKGMAIYPYYGGLLDVSRER